jgi:integrase
MRKRITMSSVHLIESSMIFGDCLTSLLPIALDSGFIDRLSYDLAYSVDRYNAPVVCVLALTCLRYSDLPSVNLYSYLKGEKVYVRQGKTESSFELPRLPDTLIRESSYFNVPEVPFLSSYSSVRYCLNQVLPRFVRQSLAGSMSVTHVFRHFRSSFLIASGLDISYVSKTLGHSSNESTKSYIHADLVDYFSSHP